ncbi:MAG: large conductance mechanosensitive channel protein MscL [Ignavibacteria bacterium]|jgi:large conductance mechanosensitive channel|nr:large conductance mechanosensitive channel protein MscL [Ignavibacteria bacterium]
MLKDFKEFINKGNVLDLAIGVMIGGAFGKIVTSLVNDIVMPPLGAINKVDLSNFFISLNGIDYPTLKAAKDAGAPTLNLGLFLNSILDFVIVSVTIFAMTRALMKFQQSKEGKEKECRYCLMKIPVQAKRCGHCTMDLQEQS